MEETVYFNNGNGTRLVGILNNPASNTEVPVVVCVHGFASHKNRPTYTMLANSLAKENIASFRFDIFGHGESDGDFEDVTVSEGVIDCEFAIEKIKSLGFSKIALCGSSFGGQIASFVASKREDILALGLKCPVTNYKEKTILKDLSKWKSEGKLLYARRNDQDLYINYSFAEDALNYDNANLSDISCPTFIVHGDKDITVPLQQSLDAKELIPNCELLVVKGADHFFETDKDLVNNSLSRFFIDFFNNLK